MDGLRDIESQYRTALASLLEARPYFIEPRVRVAPETLNRADAWTGLKGLKRAVEEPLGTLTRDVLEEAAAAGVDASPWGAPSQDAREQPCWLHEALETAQLLFVGGAAGAGKTTVLAAIARHAAQTGVATSRLEPSTRSEGSSPHELPVLLSLSECRSLLADPESGLLEVAAAHCHYRLGLPRAELSALFHRAAQEGRLWLIMDRLDSIVAPVQRGRLLQQLRALSAASREQGQPARLILSGRMESWGEDLHASGFRMAEILSLADLQIDQFLTQWAQHQQRAAAYRGRPVTASLEPWQELAQAIHHDVRLTVLAANAFLLSKLAEMAAARRPGQAMPTHRARLLDMYVDYCLQSLEPLLVEQLGTATSRGVDRQILLQLLGEIALWMAREHPDGRVPEDDLRRKLRRLLPVGIQPDTTSLTAGQIDVLLAALTRKSGLMIVDHGMAQFEHDLLFSFLVARGLCARPGDEHRRILRAFMPDVARRDAIVLCIGLLSLEEEGRARASSLLEFILHGGSREEPRLRRDLLLAAEALGEHAAPRDATVCAILDELKRAWQSRIPVVRRQVMQSLCTLYRQGIEPATEILCNALAQPQPDPEVVGALQDLTAVRRDSPLVPLLRFLLLHKDAQVARAALHSLRPLLGTDPELRADVARCTGHRHRPVRQAAFAALLPLWERCDDIRGLLEEPLRSCPFADLDDVLRFDIAQLAQGQERRDELLGILKSSALCEILLARKPQSELDKHIYIRLLCAFASTDQRALDRLVGLAEDPVRSVRAAVQFVLGMLGRALPHLPPAQQERMQHQLSAALAPYTEPPTAGAARLPRVLPQVLVDRWQRETPLVDPATALFTFMKLAASLSSQPLPPQGAEAVLQLVDCPERRVRQLAIAGLRRLPAPLPPAEQLRLRDFLLNRLRDERGPVLGLMIEALGAIVRAEDSAFDLLLRCIAQGYPKERHGALAGLSPYLSESPRLVRLFLRLLGHEDDDVVEIALQGLVPHVSSGLWRRRPLVALLKHPRPRIHIAAAISLGPFAAQSRACTRILRRWLTSGDVAQVLAAAQALSPLFAQDIELYADALRGLARTRGAADDVQRDLCDVHVARWFSSVASTDSALDLVEQRDPALGAHLRSLKQQVDRIQRDPAGFLREQESQQQIHIQDELERLVTVTAASSLPELETGPVVEVLLALLRGPVPEERAGAIHGLVNRLACQPELIAPIADRLEDPSPLVRHAAVLAVAQELASQPKYLGMLEARLLDVDDRVRLGAFQGVLGQAQQDPALCRRLVPWLGVSLSTQELPEPHALRRQLAQSIGCHLASDAALQAEVTALLYSPHALSRLGAAWALGRMPGGPPASAVEGILELPADLRDRESLPERLYAASVLLARSEWRLEPQIHREIARLILEALPYGTEPWLASANEAQEVRLLAAQLTWNIEDRAAACAALRRRLEEETDPAVLDGAYAALRQMVTAMDLQQPALYIELAPARDATLDGLKAACMHISAPNAQGSGFLISPDRILTCAHVVSSLAGGGEVCVRSPLGERTARILQLDPEEDCALLQLIEPIEGVLPLRLSDDPLARNVRWDAYGFPSVNGGHGMLLGGTVQDPCGRDARGRPTLVLFSDLFMPNSALNGFSGSPVLLNGAVIGQLRQILPDANGKPQFGLAYACTVPPLLRLGATG